MNAPDDKSREIKPLTKRTREGVLYVRRAEVELQITRALTLDRSEILRSMGGNHRRGESDYLLDETLVYLLREARVNNDDEMLEMLYLELNPRIWKLLKKYEFDTKEEFEDLGQRVGLTILEKIYDLDSNSADYAQVNFGDFVATLATGLMKAEYQRINRAKQNIELDRDDEDEPDFELDSGKLSAETKLIFQQAFASLPTQIRNAAILHYLDGWQIESKDPNEPTVARHFGVTSRTVRYWLREARRILADYQGVRR